MSKYILKEWSESMVKKKSQLYECWKEGRPSKQYNDASFNEFWEMWLDNIERENQREEDRIKARKLRIEAELHPECVHHKWIRITLVDEYETHHDHEACPNGHGCDTYNCDHKYKQLLFERDVNFLKNHMFRMSNINYMRDNVCWCIEYHSENSPNGGNLHLHLMTRCRKKDSQVINDICRIFDYSRNNHNVEMCRYSPDLYKERLNYLKGIKKDEKDPFVKKDRKWRDANELQHYYNFKLFR